MTQQSLYSEEYLNRLDEFGIPLREHVEAQDAFSDEALKQVFHRTKTGTTNWLFAKGVPTNPAELLAFADDLATVVATSLVVDGYATLTERARATKDDIDRRNEDRAKYYQVEDFIKTMEMAKKGMMPPQEDIIGDVPTGAYL